MFCLRAVGAAFVLSLVAAVAAPVGSAARRDAAAWQATELDLASAWQVTQGDAGAVVAVVDTGVQADHPALQGRVLQGYDFVHGVPGASDDNGHGTALAGIVAAACPTCRILPVKVLGADLTGDWGTVATGVRWAADHGAQVINLSLGSPGPVDTVAAAVAYALSKGVIVVAAAGNDGRNESFYPARYPGVVSVAGVDENEARYEWSNFGSWVTVAAPGCATTTWLGGGYKSDFCGTSTASPYVAAVAGLALSFRPGLSPAAFAAAAAASTSALPDPSTAGAGLLDANRLLLALGAPSGVPTLRSAPGLTGPLRIGSRLRAVTGRWTDAASFTIQWQRSADATTWQTIGTGSTYALRGGDAGHRLRVVVTAANARGGTTAASAPSAPVRVAAARTRRGA